MFEGQKLNLRVGLLKEQILQQEMAEPSRHSLEYLTRYHPSAGVGITNTCHIYSGSVDYAVIAMHEFKNKLAR